MLFKFIVIILILFASIEQSFSDVSVYDTSRKSIAKYDAQSADFGPSFPVLGLKGLVLTTHPKSGCTPILPAPSLQISGYHWIALIPRTKGNDTCDFHIKIKNAQDAKFSAVIVYNFNDDLLTMGSSERDILIPSTMISHTNGMSLVENFTYNTTMRNGTPIYYVEVSGAVYRLSAYLISLATILAIMFSALIGYMVIKLCLRRRRVHVHRLTRSALKQLKIKKFVKGDRWEVCAICLDDYVSGAKLRILPCDHAYHMKCIDPWLLNSRRQCPVCKRYVFPTGENSNEDSNGNQQTPISSERTPLMQPNEHYSPLETSRIRRLYQQQSRNAFDTVSSNAEIDASSDNDAPRVMNTNNRISTGYSLNRAALLAERFPRRSSTNEFNNMINSSGIHEPSANFVVGSLECTRENPNVSTIDDSSDIEPIDDNDEEEIMRSLFVSSESNSAYVNDE